MDLKKMRHATTENSVCILFRESPENKGEKAVAAKHLPVAIVRTWVDEDSLIVPRYSALPFYRELCLDLETLGSKPINSLAQHKWIADFDWYKDLKKYTFLSWDDHSFHCAPYNLRYVVKGKTNSRKFSWSTHMFAENKKEALQVASRLFADPMIAEQGVVYREFVELVELEKGINNLSFADEWRFFFIDDFLLCYGYYWDIADNIPTACHPSLVEFAKKIADKINAEDLARFYVLDIAMTTAGEPILVEVNDGSMSGLSCCNPETLYANLKSYLCAP